MKKYNILFLSLLLLLFAACESWLDVSPRQEMKQEQMLENEEGYKSVLTGVYILMASESLYGRNMSYYFTDYLARVWTPGQATSTRNKEDHYIPNWDFKHINVEPIIDNIWKTYYSCIVQLNDILENIDASRSMFANNNYELIKGEALGLRAFLHLELLRLFGPIPEEVAAEKLAIPYVKESTLDPGLLISLPYEEVCNRIINDLNEAEELLKVDPIISSSNSNLNSTNRFDTWETKPADSWQMARQVRFNYYAVKGTKARYYHWTGNPEEAVRFAKEVVEAKNDDGTLKFRLSNANDYSNSKDYPINLVMLSEHLFGLHNPSFQTQIQPYFKSSNSRLSQTESAITEAYEKNTLDIRNVNGRYWQKKNYPNNVVVNHFLKYSGNDKLTAVDKIPLLRLAEMYFILIENLPLGSIDTYLDEYAVSRNIAQLIGSITSSGELISRLEKEYRKEFMGEGQLFFFYKKHRYEVLTWPSNFRIPEAYADYEIPKPSSQTVFE